jgi:hypothetical protein
VLAAGFLGWEMFRRGDVASWFAFFTATGFFLIESVYGYFISNIIGLLLVFLWLGLMLHSLRLSNCVMLAASMTMGILAYFSHPWTSHVYFGCLAVFWIFLHQRKMRLPQSMARIISIFIATIVAFGLLSWYLNGNAALLIPYQLITSFNGFTTTLDFLRGGYTSNLFLFTLAAVGLLRLKHDAAVSLYLGVLFAVSGLIFLFLNEIFRFRLFIVLPLGLAAALGMVDILNGTEQAKLKRAFTCFILLFFVVYLLRSMANLI